MVQKHFVQVEDAQGQIERHPMKEWLRDNPSMLPGVPISDNTSHQLRALMVKHGWRARIDQKQVVLARPEHEPLLQVFECFEALLRKRLSCKVHTTEDSVRYTFFSALIETGTVTPSDVALEYPHPKLSRAKLDSWVSLPQPLALEFKYDRQRPGGGNRPRTQIAGAVFNDIFRLAETGTRAIFVYLTDAEMTGYFENSRNGHSEWFGLLPGESYQIKSEFLSDKPDTFRKQIISEFSAVLKCLRSSNICGHRLCILEVAK